CETTTSVGPYRETSTLRSDTVSLCGSTTHTAGRPFASVSALGGISAPGGADSLMLPVIVEPSSIAGGGAMMPTFTWNVLVAGSACGEPSRTRPVARTDGSLLSAICTTGSRGPVRISCSDTSNTA